MTKQHIAIPVFFLAYGKKHIIEQSITRQSKNVCNSTQHHIAEQNNARHFPVVIGNGEDGTTSLCKTVNYRSVQLTILNDSTEIDNKKQNRIRHNSSVFSASYDRTVPIITE